MSKFSVKKPLTVFVAVIAVLVLGVVAYLNMTPDLLPNMDFPYVMIMTTYPGASPEEVETQVTKPMEQTMATLENVKELTSTSGENYSMLLLEFEEGTNLDTVGVDIQQNISALSSSWDEMVGAPYVLKINPSMLPVMVAAVSKDGMDTVALTQYLDEQLLSKMEGITGVARVSTSGAVTQQVHVVLEKTLIEYVNGKIVDSVNGKMDEALDELESTKAQLQSAQKELEKGQAALDAGKDAVTGPLSDGQDQLSTQKSELLKTREELKKQLSDMKTAKTQLESGISVLEPIASAWAELTAQQEAQQKTRKDLETLQSTLELLSAQKTQFEAQILAIQQDASLTDQQKAEAVAALQATPEYQQMTQGLTALTQQMALYGITPDMIPDRIAQIDAVLAELAKQAGELAALLKAQGVEPETVGESLKKLQTDLATLEAGIAAVEDGIEKIDSGLLELDGAKDLLDRQKMDTMLQLITGASELNAGKATVESALTQIDSGIETLEQSRQQVLQQADLTKILTMDTINGILTAQNFSMPAGTVEQEGLSYMVSVGDKITSLEELENLLLFDPGVEGVEPIYLKDVAAVTVTDNRAQTYAKLDGLDSVMLTFEKQSTYATAQVSDNILARFEELEETDKGLHFVPLMNQGDYIYMIVEQIISSLLFGAVFAILILFLFLKDWRPTLITLCSIPVSVIFAVVLMYFSGVTINMISLSGLAVAVGMLVDNSVVVIENIYRLRAKGANVIQAAVSGAKQVAGAVTASTLTTVCVFLPIVFVEGITRQLFTDLALTMTYSLLASLIVALTLVPAMASGMLKKEKKQKTPLMDKFLAGYGKAASWALNHKVIVLVSALVLLIGSAIWSISRGFIFMPEMDMPNVTVTVTMPEGSTVEESAALADQVLERIETVDGIETTGAMMGGGMMGMSGMSGETDASSVTIYLILSDETASGAKVGKKIEKLCKDLPCEVTTSSAMMDMSMLTGSGISLQLYGEDIPALQAAAVKAAEALGKVDGVAEVSDGLEELTPALHISIDRNKAMAEGITVAQIYMELSAALQNTSTLTGMELDGMTVDVVIDKPRQEVLKADDLENYAITFTTQSAEEKTIKLSDVATVEKTTSLNAISRLQQRRYLNVTATLQPDKNVTKATAEAEKILKKTDLGEGITYSFAGENEMIMEAVEQLFLMLLLGVLLVYLVMVAQFQSLKSPFIVMFTIPLAFTGGFIALILCGMEVSVTSLVGFIMLTGIIVNNGIVLIDYINQLRQEGMERRQAIIEAGQTRMRPILMTTVTTVLGLVVMAFSKNAGTAMMQPVAVVCIGGLVYATAMTLFVVPCIYDMMNKKELRKVDEEDLKILDM